MGREKPQEDELTKLARDHQRAVEDVTNMDIGDVERVAKILEFEAQYLGAVEACREALEKRSSPRRRPN